MRKTGLIYSDVYLQHNTGRHPEKKERLSAIINYLKNNKTFEQLVLIEPRYATVDEIAFIHDRDYISSVEKSCLQNISSLDADTVISPLSYDAARLSAGGVLEAVDAVLNGTIDNAFCAVRPPGHHAKKEAAMGFCLFNNVAIGARYLRIHHKFKKILIVDWDVHHGNGTAASFYDDPSVFYFSIHQYPHYPGTGMESECGIGKGAGTTMNIHSPAQAGDEEYVKIFKERLVPAAIKFAPDFILISAGFDCHRDDPLSSINLSDEGFGELTAILCDLADRSCKGRIVSVLEGGYNLRSLSESVGCHIKKLLNC